MRTFTLTIKTTNSAFFDGHGDDVVHLEVARILHEMADRMKLGIDNSFPFGKRILFDANGNRVGLAEVS